jgi:hypothetical protein
MDISLSVNLSKTVRNILGLMLVMSVAAGQTKEKMFPYSFPESGLFFKN